VRVALLDHDHPSPFVIEVATALGAHGHEACVIACRRGSRRRSFEHGVPVVEVPRLPELPLRVRGFERPLTHLPFAVAELARGRFDVVHAFSPVDAVAARWWRRRNGGPVVFTCLRPPTRANVASRRLTLRLLEAATADSDDVLAADPVVRAAMWRWLAMEADVVPPEGHESRYRELLERPVRRKRAQLRAGPASSSRP
jgi:hypothetical protein